MIPGSISKISEGIVACADVIKVYNDLVRVTGSGTINTINPGLGTAQGQFLMLVPLDGEITLGFRGNILGGLTIPRYHVIRLVFSKPLQKWLLPVAVGLDEEDEMAETIYIPFNASDFVADNGGTWTIAPNTIYGNMYYIHGKRVTLSIIIGGSTISPANTVKIIRMRIPQAISNIAVQGPYSGFPNEPSGFVGSSIVSTDIDAIALNAIPSFCVVADTGIVPWANLAISLNSGNFPASPSGGFVILATCTYILER